MWSIAVLTPVVLALCGLVALRLADSVRVAKEREMYRAVHEIIFTVDREITAAANVLTLLKHSNMLMSGNFEGFYRRAAAAAQAVGFDLVVFDVRRNEQLMNTAFPWGTTLATGLPISVSEPQRDSLRAGKLTLFDVFFGPLVSRYMVAVGVPVPGIEAVDYVLVAVLPLDRFADLLKALRLEEDWTVTIVDHKGTVVARSKDHEQFAGQPAASRDLIKPDLSFATIMGTNRENIPFAWTYGRSELTDWVVTVGIPQYVFRGPWYFALGALIIVGIVVVFGAVTMTIRTSRRFARSLGELQHAILVVKRDGEQLPPAPAWATSRDNISDMLAVAATELLAVEDRHQFVASAVDFGTWHWDLNDRKQVWSDRYREIIGFGREVEPKHATFLDRMHPEDRQVVEDAMDCGVSQGRGFDQEFRIIRADNGEERWIRARARIDCDETGRPFRVLGALTDITTRKRAEREVQDSAARLKALVETVSDGVVLIDRSGRVLLFNPACEQLFGYPADEVIGKNVKMLMPSPQRDEHDRYISEFLRTGKRKVIGHDREVQGRRQDGTEVPLLLSVGEVRRDGESLFVGILHDLTARKLAECERDELRRQLMRAQEDERLRLAHELHDEAGQVLAATMLELKRLESAMGASGGKVLRGLHSQLDRMGQSLHRVARELRPSSIDDLGLERALADYVAEWSERFGMTVDLQCVNVDFDILSSDLKTALYRICQEGLTNISKHAIGATGAAIIVDQVDDTLRLTIEDNGCGFDTDETVKQSGTRSVGGLGLAGMRERLALLGGELQIESSVGVGTTIFARIAIDEREAITWSAKRA